MEYEIQSTPDYPERLNRAMLWGLQPGRQGLWRNESQILVYYNKNKKDKFLFILWI